MSFLRNEPVNLSRYLPAFLQSDKNLKTMLDSCSMEHEKQRLLLDDISRQFYVQTATWGLRDWESLLDLKPAISETFSQRRNRVLLYLQHHQTSTILFLEKLADRYISYGSTRITERNPESCFIVSIDSQADLSKLRIDVSGMHEALDLYKPAHLAYYLVIQPGRQLGLNSAGPVKQRVIPDKKWTETQHHIVFPACLNASGSLKMVKHRQEFSQAHSAVLFTAGTLNGRIRLNNAAHDSEERDLGIEVTEHWKVFAGSRMNARAAPRLNDAPTKEQSRTYHQADWREVISYKGGSLNTAKSRVKKWSTSKITERLEKGFSRPPYALNRIGTVTTSWQDIGRDEQQTETLFHGSCLNGSAGRRIEKKQASTTTIHGIVFTGSRLNSRKRCTLNNAASEATSKTSTTEKTIVSYLFSGPLLNGNIRLNGGRPETITRTVHIPVWRNVKHYHGATLLNACKHSVKDVQIEHVTPGRTEKFFDPTRGTLLNNHAVLGYLRL